MRSCSECDCQFLDFFSFSQNLLDIEKKLFWSKYDPNLQVKPTLEFNGCTLHLKENIGLY